MDSPYGCTVICHKLRPSGRCTELATQGFGGGHGFGSAGAGATGCGPDRTKRQGRVRTCGGATGQCSLNPARATQALTGALPVGRADRTFPENLRDRPQLREASKLCPQLFEIPLLCPLCGGQMRLIAFITEGAQIRRILDHIGVDSEPPHISQARGPPLWEDCDAQMGEGVEIEPDWDLVAQPAPNFDVDQRVNW